MAMSIQLEKLAVTLSFFFGALVITFVVLAYFDGYAAPVQDLSPEIWFRTLIRTSGFAALSGVAIDAIRHIASTDWTRKPSIRVRPGKLLKRHQS
jgi:hypothetical protein